jgi:hypothetical protein
MSSQPMRNGLAYTAGILGSFLIIAAMVWAMRYYTQPAPLGEDRAAVRAKALAELRAAEAEAMNNTAWIDKTKGLVRLRVEDAVKLVERDWAQNPVAARSNLILRVEKATFVPPKPPEKPSQFE